LQASRFFLTSQGIVGIIWPAEIFFFKDMYQVIQGIMENLKKEG
jgi:hypothetical protein